MRKYPGFTLIEVMIAIAVFSIGVLAVMRVLTQNLVTMDKVETRTTATFLAREGLEMMYAMRDANLQKGLPRHCILSGSQDTTYVLSTTPSYEPSSIHEDVSHPCELSLLSGGTDALLFLPSFVSGSYMMVESIPSLSGDELFAAARLRAFTGSAREDTYHRYGMGSGETTFFARYLVFTGVRADGQTLPYDQIMKVESHVLYRKGTSQGEVVLEGMIGRR